MHNEIQSLTDNRFHRDGGSSATLLWSQHNGHQNGEKVWAICPVCSVTIWKLYTIFSFHFSLVIFNILNIIKWWLLLAHINYALICTRNCNWVLMERTSCSLQDLWLFCILDHAVFVQHMYLAWTIEWLILSWSNLLWWHIIISTGTPGSKICKVYVVHIKVKFTIRSGSLKIRLSHVLNWWTFCNETWYAG